MQYLFMIICPVFTIIMIDWSVHINMTKSRCDVYGWGNRKLFWKNFKKYNLENDGLRSNSYFSGYTKSCFHASIIKFNGIGMLLNPIDWILVNKDIKKINKKSNYIWKDEE